MIKLLLYYDNMEIKLLSSLASSTTIGGLTAFHNTYFSGANPILSQGILLILLLFNIYAFVTTKSIASRSIQLTILLLAIFVGITLSKRWAYSF